MRVCCRRSTGAILVLAEKVLLGAGQSRCLAVGYKDLEPLEALSQRIAVSRVWFRYNEQEVQVGKKTKFKRPIYSVVSGLLGPCVPCRLIKILKTDNNKELC